MPLYVCTAVTQSYDESQFSALTVQESQYIIESSRLLMLGPSPSDMNGEWWVRYCTGLYALHVRSPNLTEVHQLTILSETRGFLRC